MNRLFKEPCSLKGYKLGDLNRSDFRAGGKKELDATFYIEQAVFNYRVAAVMVVDGHVLIHKQGNDPYWALPGGRVELMEESQASIIREIREELGFDVKVDRLLWFAENFFDYDNKSFHEIGLYYTVSLIEGEFSFRDEPFYGEEGKRLLYKWYPVNQLDEILLYPEFLKDQLNELPHSTQHIVIK
jgi:8-oxo-dGTP pyrophosphatase MutT (NUDIX family)